MPMLIRALSYSGLVCMVASVTFGIGPNAGLFAAGVALLLTAIWEADGNFE